MPIQTNLVNMVTVLSIAAHGKEYLLAIGAHLQVANRRKRPGIIDRPRHPFRQVERLEDTARIVAAGIDLPRLEERRRIMVVRSILPALHVHQRILRQNRMRQERPPAQLFHLFKGSGDASGRIGPGANPLLQTPDLLQPLLLILPRVLLQEILHRGAQGVQAPLLRQYWLRLGLGLRPVAY